MGVTAAALSAAALTLASPASAGAEVKASLAGDAKEVSQGAPFTYRVTVDNPNAVSEQPQLHFILVKPGTSKQITFDYWTSSLGPYSDSKFKRSVTPSQWFPDRGRYEVVLQTTLGATLDRTSFEVTRPTVRVPRFRDVTAAKGLEVLHKAEIGCDTWMAGATWLDSEGDGDLDLYLPHGTAPAQLFVNQGGRFVDRATEAGVDNAGSTGIGAVATDYDNDGDQDIYVLNDGPNRLYQNDGRGHYQDVAPAAGVAEDGPSMSAAWGDYDNDGNLDLYVANYGRCVTNQAQTYATDTLYHSDGDGTFSDQTALLGPSDSTLGLGLAVAWWDYDRDRDLDLYLGNDFTGARPLPNEFWRNNGSTGDGSWGFSNVSVETGTRLSINTMGIGISDYDRDLDFDMALSNIEATVLLNNKGGRFNDVADYARVARPQQRVREKSVTWGLAFADFNHDGWEDLYVPAGSLGLEATPEPQPNGVFANRRGRFFDLSALSGADDPQMGRGAAFGDYDRDGDVDVYVVNQLGYPKLFENVTRKRGSHWLQVRLIGARSNRDGCGATLIARINRRTKLLRQAFCGSTSAASGSEHMLHFGLGGAERVRSLTIEWPSGARQVLRRVRVDRRITVKEPGN